LCAKRIREIIETTTGIKKQCQSFGEINCLIMSSLGIREPAISSNCCVAVPIHTNQYRR
jgi:hypothetical protein